MLCSKGSIRLKVSCSTVIIIYTRKENSQSPRTCTFQATICIFIYNVLVLPRTCQLVRYSSSIRWRRLRLHSLVGPILWSVSLLMILCPRLYCYYCVNIGECHRYWCTACEFRITAEIELHRKHRTLTEVKDPCILHKD